MPKPSVCKTHTIALELPLAEMLGVAPGKPKAVLEELVGVVLSSPPANLKLFSREVLPRLDELSA